MRGRRAYITAVYRYRLVGSLFKNPIQVYIWLQFDWYITPRKLFSQVLNDSQQKLLFVHHLIAFGTRGGGCETVETQWFIPFFSFLLFHQLASRMSYTICWLARSFDQWMCFFYFEWEQNIASTSLWTGRYRPLRWSSGERRPGKILP